MPPAPNPPHRARRAIADAATVFAAVLVLAGSGLILSAATALPWELRCGLWLLGGWLPVTALAGWLAEPDRDRRR